MTMTQENPMITHNTYYVARTAGARHGAMYSYGEAAANPDLAISAAARGCRIDAPGAMLAVWRHDYAGDRPSPYPGHAAEPTYRATLIAIVPAKVAP